MAAIEFDLVNAANCSTGTQLRDFFRKVNIAVESEIVDWQGIRSPGVAFPGKGNGSQIKDAFAAVNTFFGKEEVDLHSLSAPMNGNQLKAAVQATITAIQGYTPTVVPIIKAKKPSKRRAVVKKTSSTKLSTKKRAPAKKTSSKKSKKSVKKS